MRPEDLLILADRVLLLGCREPELLLELAQGVRGMAETFEERCLGLESCVKRAEERADDVASDLECANEALHDVREDMKRQGNFACAFAFDVGMRWVPK